MAALPKPPPHAIAPSPEPPPSPARSIAPSGLQTLARSTGFAAHAGGGQASATPLTAMQNNVTTLMRLGRADHLLGAHARPMLSS